MKIEDKSETREEMILRWEKEGRLDPNCYSCRDYYYYNNLMPNEVFAPSHKASDHCQSGKYNHCTCDSCF